MATNYEWWKSAVFYQIYPRSFADGNGDGMGDFRGMISKLDYLKDLGVDAVWLSPHYPSPYVDCGYDISDYEGVAPEYGNMQDFKLFLEGLHQRGMYLVIDLVLNHTSDKHPWFIESRSNLDNPKRDWYVWKKGKGKDAPNNWCSTFGGSAWELDEKTGEYYYHFFFKEQPDLNWSNPKVKEAMFNSVRFWLDMGVDGFRLDAVGTIFEDERYLDHPESRTLEDLQVEYFKRSQKKQPCEDLDIAFDNMFQYQHDMPGVHELMSELRQVIDEYDNRVLIGETDDLAFYGNGDDELHLVFNFPLMRTSRITAEHVRKNQKVRTSGMPKSAWPCNTLGNHDRSRMFTAFGDGDNNDLINRVNLMLLLTLKGTPFLYNGEEIGMSDYLGFSRDEFKDPLSINYAILCEKLAGLSESEATRVGAEKGRDRNRTPMQWSAADNGGFCPKNIKPWLTMNPEFQTGVNVADEVNNIDSLWHFYRKLLHLRRQTPALMVGSTKELRGLPEGILAYERKTRKSKCLVVLNFSEQAQRFEKQKIYCDQVAVICEGKTGQWCEQENSVTIGPFGCVLLCCDK
jgi:alpha-glucosidase